MHSRQLLLGQSHHFFQKNAIWKLQCFLRATIAYFGKFLCLACFTITLPTNCMSKNKETKITFLHECFKINHPKFDYRESFRSVFRLRLPCMMCIFKSNKRQKKSPLGKVSTLEKGKEDSPSKLNGKMPIEQKSTHLLLFDFFHKGKV